MRDIFYEEERRNLKRRKSFSVISFMEKKVYRKVLRELLFFKEKALEFLEARFIPKLRQGVQRKDPFLHGISGRREDPT